jgi:hypothetical protein
MLNMTLLSLSFHFQKTLVKSEYWHIQRGLLPAGCDINVMDPPL